MTRKRWRWLFALRGGEGMKSEICVWCGKRDFQDNLVHDGVALGVPGMMTSAVPMSLPQHQACYDAYWQLWGRLELLRRQDNNARKTEGPTEAGTAEAACTDGG